MARVFTNRKSGFIRRDGVMRRESVWFFITQNQLSIPTATTAVLLQGFNAAALALRPFTIVRTRVNLLLTSDQLAATEDQEIGYAMSIVTDQAAAIGVTAVPTPMTDQGSDQFFVYELLYNSFQFADSTGFDASVGRERIVDSKAMRKVKESDDLALTVETSAQSEGIVLVSGGRMLVKLH